MHTKRTLLETLQKHTLLKFHRKNHMDLNVAPPPKKKERKKERKERKKERERENNSAVSLNHFLIQNYRL